MHRQSDQPRHDPPSLRVLAAGSLKASFDTLAAVWGSQNALPVALSYDNARELARRVEDGDSADVFASASPEHPAALYACGLVDEPRPFATNRLVVAVPSDSPADGAEILARPGIRVVIEGRGIPLGDYTQTLLERCDETLGDGFARAVMRNVVGEEQTVGAVIERLCSGRADVAILYSTDIPPTAGRLRAIEVPAGTDVTGTYVIATVRASRQPAAARAWVALVTAQTGQGVLRAGGFGAAP